MVTTLLAVLKCLDFNQREVIEVALRWATFVMVSETITKVFQPYQVPQRIPLPGSSNESGFMALLAAINIAYLNFLRWEYTE